MFADLMNSLLAREKPATVLHLFGEPCLTLDAQLHDLPEGGKRVLAFAALHTGRLDRRYVACTLWPDADELRAAGNLRSALWRLKQSGAGLLIADRSSLSLNPQVLVDVHVLSRWAGRLITGDATADDLAFIPHGVDRQELVHGCYDDWLITERELIRQRLLHALEELSRRLIQLGRCAEAVEAAVLAVGIEPLRESAHRSLIEAHLADGNRLEGRRDYEAYCDLLDRELGVRPAFQEPAWASGFSVASTSGHTAAMMSRAARAPERNAPSM